MIGKPPGEREFKKPNEYQEILGMWLDACFDRIRCGNCVHLDTCYDMFAEIYGWSEAKWKKGKVDKEQMVKEVKEFLKDFVKRKSIDTK